MTSYALVISCVQHGYQIFLRPQLLLCIYVISMLPCLSFYLPDVLHASSFLTLLFLHCMMATNHNTCYHCHVMNVLSAKEHNTDLHNVIRSCPSFLKTVFFVGGFFHAISKHGALKLAHDNQGQVVTRLVL